MHKFVLNIESITAIGDCDTFIPFLDNLCMGIQQYLSHEQKFEVYAIEANLANLPVGEECIFSTAIDRLEREKKSFLVEFISMRRSNDKLYSDTDLFDQVTETSIYINTLKAESLAYAYRLENSLVCSCGINNWDKNTLYAQNINEVDGTYENIQFKNIFNRASGIFHRKNIFFNKLPTVSNITYSNEFKDWLFDLSLNNSEKVITKLNFLKENNFEGGRETAIESIRKSSLENLKEIIVGNAIGQHFGAIRVLFVQKDAHIYILSGFIKQNVQGNEESALYLAESNTANTIFSTLYKN